jgi:hypothetical protein
MSEIEKITAVMLSQRKSPDFKIDPDLTLLVYTDLFKKSLKLFSNEIAEFYKMIGEEIITERENDTKAFLEKLAKQESSFFTNEIDRPSFFSFMCLQYIRTRYIRERFKSFQAKKPFEEDIRKFLNKCNSIPDKFGVKIDKEKALNEINVGMIVDIEKVLRFVYHNLADELAFSLSLRLNKLVYLIAPEGISFITSDQPAINLKINELDSQGNVTDFEFYYPVNPDLAILLSSNDNRCVCRKELDYEEAKSYNKFMVDNAHSFVYSSKESDLVSM